MPQKRLIKGLIEYLVSFVVGSVIEPGAVVTLGQTWDRNV